MDYELNLSGAPRGATISNLGIEHHSPSIVFWIKAGVGFSVGMIFTYTVAWLLYIMLIANLAIAFGRAFAR